MVVLIIAIFNFVNLSTARATQRGKEVGVRKMAGAGRLSLIFQFLLEAFLIVFAATVSSVLIASQLMPVLNQIADKQLAIPFYLPSFWLYSGLFIFTITLLSGFYPAFVLSAYLPAKVLKGFFTLNAGDRFRKSLVIGQFALSIVFITSTLTIYNQLKYIKCCLSKPRFLFWMYFNWL